MKNVLRQRGTVFAPLPYKLKYKASRPRCLISDSRRRRLRGEVGGREGGGGERRKTRTKTRKRTRRRKFRIDSEGAHPRYSLSAGESQTSASLIV